MGMNNYWNKLDNKEIWWLNKRSEQDLTDYDIEKLITEEIKNLPEEESNNLTAEGKEDLAIKRLAEKELKERYISSSRFESFLIYINRENILKNIIDNLKSQIHDKRLTDEEKEELAIKNLAEAELKQEYNESPRFKSFVIYLTRKKLIKDKIERIKNEKKEMSMWNFKEAESLKKQLGLNVNTDRTPVWWINTEDLIEARHNEVAQQIENKK